MKTRDQVIQDIQNSLSVKFIGNYEDTRKWLKENPTKEPLIIIKDKVLITIH